MTVGWHFGQQSSDATSSTHKVPRDSMTSKRDGQSSFWNPKRLCETEPWRRNLSGIYTLPPWWREKCWFQLKPPETTLLVKLREPNPGPWRHSPSILIWCHFRFDAQLPFSPHNSWLRPIPLGTSAKSTFVACGWWPSVEPGLSRSLSVLEWSAVLPATNSGGVSSFCVVIFAGTKWRICNSRTFGLAAVVGRVFQSSSHRFRLRMISRHNDASLHETC